MTETIFFQVVHEEISGVRRRFGVFTKRFFGLIDLISELSMIVVFIDDVRIYDQAVFSSFTALGVKIAMTALTTLKIYSVSVRPVYLCQIFGLTLLDYFLDFSF